MTAPRHRKTRRIPAMILTVVALSVGLTLLQSGTAFADAGTSASCMGHESSGIAPAGSSDEFPGGRRQLQEFIQEAFPGIPPGAISSFIAQLHEGSHEGCDEVLD